MNLIDSSVERITERHPLKLIERVGRTCYKSEDKITSDSYKEFVRNLIRNQHFAMLEHGRIVLELIVSDVPSVVKKAMHDSVVEAFFGIPHVHVYYTTRWDGSGVIDINMSISHVFNPKWQENKEAYKFIVLARNHICEELDLPTDDFDEGYDIEHLVYYPYLGNVMNEDEEIYITLKFICDRGVSHELVRHRIALAQESTRYCNYAKNTMYFIRPDNYSDWDDYLIYRFESFLAECESRYVDMVSVYGFSPQQARAVLPNALKTEVVCTANVKEWNHILDVRYRAKTGSPHPDMLNVMEKAYHLLPECQEFRDKMRLDRWED